MKKVIAGLGVISLSLFLLGGCASTPKQESAGQYIDSSGITTQVKANLIATKDIPGGSIKVDTFKNNVQLSGFVNTYRQKEEAGKIAQATPGVNSVINNIIVKPGR